MVRKAHTKPVTAQMYRHFAALTVAATLALAMIASGENREAVAREVEAHKPKPKMQVGGLERRDRRRPPRQQFSGDGYDPAFGQPMDVSGATVQGAGVIPGDTRPFGGAGVPAGFTQYGVSSEVWAGLTPDQQKALIARRKAEQAAASAPERKQQIDALMAASRARSGGGERPAD